MSSGLGAWLALFRFWPGRNTRLLYFPYLQFVLIQVPQQRFSVDSEASDQIATVDCVA